MAQAAASAHRFAGHTLALRGLTHRFASTVALDDVSLDIAAGELVALLGPSGCGKTTLLRAVAGFVRPDRGAIAIDGQPVGDMPTAERGVGIVFQSYALFPHMTVFENVAYGLRARGAAGVEARVGEMLDLVRMASLRDRLPRQLSGGQQQRVAVARVLAVEPRILLLDEPFSALDRSLRLDMQIEIKRLQRELGLTAVLVTHDQDEAMSMADRIAVMDRGKVRQFAPPVEVYDRPADVFVNNFIGSTNLLAGAVEAGDEGVLRVRLADGALLALPATRRFARGSLVWASVRPENWRLDGPRDGIAGRIALVMPIGAQLLYEIEIGGGQRIKALVKRDGRNAAAADAPIRLAIDDTARVSVFPRNTNPNEEAHP